MSFLNSAMLFGMAALAIPIIVHLLNRRRFKKLPWAAMRFLQVSLERNQRRMKVEDWILLLLRLALVALLALALSRPAANWLDSQSLGSKIASTVIIDSSGSMGRTDEGSEKTRHEIARNYGTEAIKTLPRGSAASIIFAANSSGSGITEPTHDLSRAEKSLGEDNAATLTNRGSDLMPAVQAALASLANRSAAQKELIIVTDGDANAWNQFESIIRVLEGAPEDVRSVIAVVGGNPGENLAITRLSQNTPVTAVGQPLRLAVEVSNFGVNSFEDIPVSLTIDNKAVGEPVEIESLPPGESRTLTLFAQLPSPGLHQIAVSIEGNDSFPADDRRVLVVRAIEKERALLVDGLPARNPTDAETFFLENALVPVPPELRDSFFLGADRITVAGLEEIQTEKLAEYRAVFLANVQDFSSGVTGKLKNFIINGGGLIVFPGDNINASWYNDELYKKGGILPAEFGEIIPGEDDEITLNLQASGYDHPLVELWNDPGAGTLAEVNIRKAYSLILAEDAEQPGGANASTRVVLRYNTGSPAVVESDLGLGKVYQFSSTADTEWNNLPVQPAFLPIVHRVFGSVLARRDAGLNVSTGDSFVHQGPAEWANKKAQIFKPDSGGIGEEITIMANGEGSQITYDQVQTAGVYELSIPDALPLTFAAGADAGESNPEPLSEAQIQRLRGSAEVIYTTAGGELSALIERERSGTELWPLFLLAAGLIAIIELFLSQRFSQEK
ncbi:MAG: BatA domain-containing protein [Verrucomicrobiales bacterium]|nr:BatA domain-containing protein [Verrucomicrobiales bacterium]